MAFSWSSKILPNSSLAFFLSSILNEVSSLNCLCFSANLSNSSTNPACFAAATSAELPSLVISLAVFTNSLGSILPNSVTTAETPVETSVIASATFATTSFPALTAVLTTPKIANLVSSTPFLAASMLLSSPNIDS